MGKKLIFLVIVLGLASTGFSAIFDGSEGSDWNTALNWDTSSVPTSSDGVTINPPDHVAVGVLGSEDLYGVSYNVNGNRYYYCETTGSGWEIGECPDEYKNETAKIIEL